MCAAAIRGGLGGPCATCPAWTRPSASESTCTSPFRGTGFDVEAGLAQLRAHGIDVHDWQMREPSLEDVFLSYIHRRASGPGGRGNRGRPMTEFAVDVKGLTRVFDTFVAVDHIDLQVAAGTVFGFLGPNGAGKSTTIRMLCGILRPSAGTGTVGGFDIATSDRATQEQHRLHVATLLAV